MSLKDGMICPHCGKFVDIRSGLTATHDYPKHCRQVCPGSGQYPRYAWGDGRLLWNGQPNKYFQAYHEAIKSADLTADEYPELLERLKRLEQDEH